MSNVNVIRRVERDSWKERGDGRNECMFLRFKTGVTVSFEGLAIYIAISFKFLICFDICVSEC